MEVSLVLSPSTPFLFYVPFSGLRLQDDSVDDDECLQTERDLMESIKPMMEEMHLPPITLGSGRTNLAWKFYVLCHAAFLVAGATLQSFVAMMSSFMIHTSDYGTEFGLPRIKPIQIRLLFPWMSDPTTTATDVGHVIDDDFFDPDEASSMLDEKVSIDSCIAAAGLLHILHNAADNITDAMPAVI